MRTSEGGHWQVLAARDRAVDRLRRCYSDSEQKCAELGGQLHATGGLLHEAHLRCADLQVQLDSERCRCIALGNEMERANARVQQLDRLLHQSGLRCAELDRQVHECERRHDELRGELDALLALGPAALGLARRFHALAGKFPRLRNFLKNLLVK